MTALGVAAALLAGCAGRGIEGGVFRSPKGYRVSLLGPEWEVVNRSPADLQLRRRTGAAGMLVNATCAAGATRPPAAALERRLMAGLRERMVLEREEAALGGRPATRTVLEARGPDGGRVRVEAYLLVGDRCVYDLIYAAAAAEFPTWRRDFARFVESFVAE